ncbi:MAG: hypothetical protein Q9191_004041 [Dirinaria sp. TL-2023a]
MTGLSELQGNLQDWSEGISGPERPILTHLNADTSWLLQLPWKDAPTGRSRFNCLIDPWFRGVQVDFAPWFSRQWHAIESSVQSVAELNERLFHIERFVRFSGPHSRDELDRHKTYIDAVVISHQFTDHCNKQTLLELDVSTVIFAHRAAASTIRSWNHFTFVKDLPHLSSNSLDWRQFSTHPLPDWLAIFRIVTSLDLASTHSAVVLCFNLNSGGPDGSQSLQSVQAEAVVYTPHGLPAENLQILSKASPTINPLLLIHGMHEVSIGWLGQINLGALNGLRCWQTCGAKYWVPTHDEIKIGKGLINSLLRRNILTLQEALSKQKDKESNSSGDGLVPAELDGLRFRELRSGQCLILA